ncbi:hypothetical protein DFH07DRAFT_782750 [Mycena maculata]|uniref:Uncharacterized protein n=1 Tax=Mycena maculata TaxID=230809 RepID=A0AAD7HQY6_9AGAR|nr:hypothetical protein DFH07DRAFT_782750 [Mycena maculata]
MHADLCLAASLWTSLGGCHLEKNSWSTEPDDPTGILESFKADAEKIYENTMVTGYDHCLQPDLNRLNDDIGQWVGLYPTSGRRCPSQELVKENPGFANRLAILETEPPGAEFTSSNLDSSQSAHPISCLGIFLASNSRNSLRRPPEFRTQVSSGRETRIIWGCDVKHRYSVQRPDEVDAAPPITYQNALECGARDSDSARLGSLVRWARPRPTRSATEAGIPRQLPARARLRARARPGSLVGVDCSVRRPGGRVGQPRTQSQPRIRGSGACAALDVLASYSAGLRAGADRTRRWSGGMCTDSMQSWAPSSARKVGDQIHSRLERTTGAGSSPASPSTCLSVPFPSCAELNPNPDPEPCTRTHVCTSTPPPTLSGRALPAGACTDAHVRRGDVRREREEADRALAVPALVGEGVAQLPRQR